MKLPTQEQIDEALGHAEYFIQQARLPDVNIQYYVWQAQTTLEEIQDLLYQQKKDS